MEARVVIHKNKSLGSGAYGAVYKAQMNELPCAAKILHPILLENSDPNELKIVDRFYLECELMKAISHPNIVQYLGLTKDPDTDLPALLMELLDESLTGYLDRVKKLPSYCTQVNLSHDVALAIAHLHSKGIVHRDLSSNNILLIAGSKAKVSDFGMSKIIDVSGTSSRHSLTQVPGTHVYMPPEAFLEPPDYSNKIDCFSFGPLIIQLLTAKFPDPGPRFTMVADLHSPVGVVQVPVLEEERRRSHIALIESSHPLLSIAKECLKYKSSERPTAQQLCQQLAQLKELQKFLEHTEEITDIVPVQELQSLQKQNRCFEETIRNKSLEFDRLNDLLQAKEEECLKQAQKIANLEHHLLSKDDIIHLESDSTRILTKEAVSKIKHSGCSMAVLEAENSNPPEN